MILTLYGTRGSASVKFVVSRLRFKAKGDSSADSSTASSALAVRPALVLDASPRRRLSCAALNSGSYLGGTCTGWPDLGLRAIRRLRRHAEWRRCRTFESHALPRDLSQSLWLRSRTDSSNCSRPTEVWIALTVSCSSLSERRFSRASVPPYAFCISHTYKDVRTPKRCHFILRDSIVR